jgi:hypothetical protein
MGLKLSKKTGQRYSNTQQHSDHFTQVKPVIGT